MFSLSNSLHFSNKCRTVSHLKFKLGSSLNFYALQALKNEPQIIMFQLINDFSP